MRRRGKESEGDDTFVRPGKPQSQRQLNLNSTGQRRHPHILRLIHFIYGRPRCRVIAQGSVPGATSRGIHEHIQGPGSRPIRPRTKSSPSVLGGCLVRSENQTDDEIGFVQRSDDLAREPYSISMVLMTYSEKALASEIV